MLFFVVKQMLNHYRFNMFTCFKNIFYLVLIQDNIVCAFVVNGTKYTEYIISNCKDCAFVVFQFDFSIFDNSTMPKAASGKRAKKYPSITSSYQSTTIPRLYFCKCGSCAHIARNSRLIAT